MGYIEEADNANDAMCAEGENKAEILQTLEEGVKADPIDFRKCFGEAIDQVDAVQLHKLWMALETEAKVDASCPFAMGAKALKICTFLANAVNPEIQAEAYSQWENNYENS